MFGLDIPSVSVEYVAVHRETGRECKLYEWQVSNPGWVDEWLSDGWDVKTVVSDIRHFTVGEVVYLGLVANPQKQIASLKSQIEEMRADRDTWKALANG